MTVEQYQLMRSYGVWTRTQLVKGYAGYSPRHRTNPVQYIDDATALKIDKALQSIKQNRPKAYRLIELHFLKGIECSRIKSHLKKTDPEFANILRYLCGADIYQILDSVLKPVFEQTGL